MKFSKFEIERFFRGTKIYIWEAEFSRGGISRVKEFSRKRVNLQLRSIDISEGISIKILAWEFFKLGCSWIGSFDCIYIIRCDSLQLISPLALKIWSEEIISWLKENFSYLLWIKYNYLWVNFWETLNLFQNDLLTQRGCRWIWEWRCLLNDPSTMNPLS